ncbi:MAG: hypothetical protein DRP02_14420 [Candidatus Gerdarchaeota archaeon]|nr:MAG: hypothetical protein DRP02_14420 [Candidatus Gerdarchaeota archaeon]
MDRRKLPVVSTISRALSQMKSEEVEKVRSLSRSLVVEGLKREWLTRLTFGCDDSVLSTNEHAEGTAVGFKKAKTGACSCYPPFCTAAQTVKFFDVYNRPGNVCDSNGADQFMVECFKQAKNVRVGIVESVLF